MIDPERPERLAETTKKRDSSPKIENKAVEIQRGIFMAKLLDKGVLEVERKKQYQNIIIFDWDDTLLCTSYFNPDQEGDLEVVKDTYKDILKVMDKAVE